jgi:ATP-dependent RNA helicase DeaD
MKFSELDLDQKTLSALAKMGWENPTEVQEKAIRKVREGRNLIVRSQTGTGKTGAFGIGLIERLAEGSSHKALILAPTRELALQVCKELREIAAGHDLKIHAVFGGQSINLQVRDLEGGFDMIVATPGRLLDLGRRRVVDISKFDAIVLDEADHMLDLGFMDEVTDILKQLPEQRTMMLFSATIDQSILSMASEYIPNPETIEIGEIEVVSTITEEHVEITRREKFPQLLEVLQSHQGMKVLIFMETKRGTMWLCDKLKYKGYNDVGMLHGDMTQARRNAMLSKFKKGALNILVATNVAARGLHIDDVGLIVNYDKAESEETHLHRVGRTGRMGAEGKVVNFVPRKESRDERMDEDHPDFAWMRRGGVSNYSKERGERPPRRDSRRPSGRRPSGRKPEGRSGDRRRRTPRKKY